MELILAIGIILFAGVYGCLLLRDALPSAFGFLRVWLACWERFEIGSYDRGPIGANAR